MSSAAPPTDGRRECALLRAVLDRNPDAIAMAVHSTATAAVVPSRELPGSNGAPPTSVDIDGFFALLRRRHLYQQCLLR